MPDCFTSITDVYDCVYNFMLECNFAISVPNAFSLFSSSSGVLKADVLQDPYYNHKVCICCTNRYIAMFVFDGYAGGYIYDQINIPKGNRNDKTAWGAAIKVGVYANTTAPLTPIGKCNYLFCSYTNKTLIISYCPIDCNLYSHCCDSYTKNGVHTLFYGNFTRYHVQYDRDVVFLFSTDGCCLADSKNALALDLITTTAYSFISGFVYCKPEASNDIYDHTWYFSRQYYNFEKFDSKGRSLGIKNSYTYFADDGYTSLPLITSFDNLLIPVNLKIDGNYADYLDIPYYFNLFRTYTARVKTLLASTLNNTSVLLPLIVYGYREPRVLKNWSAIGETKLVNLIDMSHISPGEVFIDNGVDKDYHKYITFPINLTNWGIRYSFVGLAIEIYAEEELLKEQDIENNIIWLNDSYRNFDRLKIIYEDNYKTEWTYDIINPLIESKNPFNLTKDSNYVCMVEGSGNDDTDIIEYKLIYTQSCKINSIIGYRE